MQQLAPGYGARSAPIDPRAAEFDWSRILHTITARRKLVVAAALVTFALIAGYTLLSPPVYTTHVKLIAGGTGSAQSAAGTNSTLPLLNALLAASGMQTSETYAELFQETPVAQRVIDDLGLNMSPGALMGTVNVKPVVNTNLLDVSVRWSSAEKSAQVANAFAGAFVDRERALVAGQADDAIKTLDQQLPSAEKKAVEAETALTQFEAKNDLADVQTQTQNAINAAAAIDAKLGTTNVDQRQAQAQLNSVTAQLASVVPTVSGDTNVAPNPVYSGLEQQLAQATVQLQVAEQQYTDEHPTVIGLKHQVAELQRQLGATPATVVAGANTVPNPVYQSLSQNAATLRAQIAADAATSSELERQHKAMQPKIAALPAKATRLFELQRDAKMADDVLAALQQKRNEASISKATALSDVTITSPATASEAEVRPNRMLNLIVGFFMSVVVGLCAALVVQIFDRRLRSERQIEEEVNLPVLASVPKLSVLRNRLDDDAMPRLALPNAGDQGREKASQQPDIPWLRAYAVESFLQLVTAIRYSSTADKQIRSITVTSAKQGDGKSTIALNTAIAMAHIQPRVLLIDADLRRPSLHDKLNRELGLGLSDVLVGSARLADVITPTEHEGLDLLTSGTRTPNSVKLLQSGLFDEIVKHLLETYRTIVIDAPALGPVVDAAILAAKSDGTILVVAVGDSDGDTVRRAITRLQSFGCSNILGTVANRAPVATQDVDDDYFASGPPMLQTSLS